MEKDTYYDIGVVCAINLNIGNNLTNYALYQYLCDLGYSVLLISNPLEASLDFSDERDDRFFQFLQFPYSENTVVPPRKNKWELSDINLICGQFVLGSDQLWRDFFVKETDYFTCLDWVESRKNKIAYGTSFGIDYLEGDASEQEKIGYLLRRFQNISVREQSGVRLLKELYGIEAEHVLDPVFLCDKRYYEKMAERGRRRLPEGKYVGAYLLDITEEKETAVIEAAEYLAEGVYAAISPDPVGRLQFLSEPAIEEWLAMIEKCDFLITDSFHGMCFALIFQKQFSMVFEKENWRGFTRIQSMLHLLKLDYLLEEDLSSKPIDYAAVNKILFEECSKSKEWLKTCLDKGKDYKGCYDSHDLIWELCGQLFRKFHELEEVQEWQMKQRVKDYRIRNELFKIMHGPNREQRGIQIVGWGAGECFKRNINYIKSFCDMRYVCDSNPEKWGKELEGQAFCISPERLAEMKDILVIIMVDNAGIAFQIAQKLLEMGISNFEHIENWISFVAEE